MKMNVLKLIFAIVVFGAVLISGCTNKNISDSGTAVSTADETITDGSDNVSDKLAGTWSIDKYTSYYFDGIGNGKLILPNSEYEFKYIINENTVELDFDKTSVDDSVYEYQINNKKLTLKSKDNNKGTFELSKK